MKLAAIPSRRSLLILICCLQAGCGATRISLAPSSPGANPGDGPRKPIVVAPRAEGLPETVGYGTVTVFAIPATPVQFSDADPAARVMDGLRDVLGASGYRAVTAPPGRIPYVQLNCRINEMRFRNYTWLMPLVVTWGKIRLTLTLEAADGTDLWQRTYEAKYSRRSMGESFHKAVNTTLRDIWAQAAVDFTSDEFRTHCCPVRKSRRRAAAPLGSLGASSSGICRLGT